jgi:BolA family transcriptional regulator, general stress-responsive regulator
MTDHRPVATEITRRITEILAPSMLVVVDDSENHRGHGGHREGIETHLTLRITAAAFNGKGRVDRQRMVYDILSDLMENPIHALSLDLKPSL